MFRFSFYSHALNVFKNINVNYEEFDFISRTGPFIDFHGLSPYENLFEELDGFYVHSGGDLDVLPHSGIRNTFWNVKTPEAIQRFDYATGEFFNTTATSRNMMYKYHPASIVVGVHGKSGAEILIDRNPYDRVEEFIQVYNFNSSVVPVDSLFEAQKAVREVSFPLPPSPPVLFID